MEQHGPNPQNNVIAIIPARYESVRLPGKMLLEIAGRPLILHTLERAKKAKSVSRVLVATDDERIFRVVVESGAEAVMTSAAHASGSDRIAEAAESMPVGSIIVNVQGDEPLISPDTIDRAVNALVGDENADMATVTEPIERLGDLLNANVVKAVTGDNGYALYFSRSPIPFPREAASRYGGDLGRAIAAEPELLSLFRKHTGIYAYRQEYLLKFTKLPQSRLERTEMLEQIRALEDGAKIRVVEAASRSIGVDTQEDLESVRKIIAGGETQIREASASDVPEIARVHVESWKGSFKGIAPQDHLDSLSIEKRKLVFGKRLSEPTYRLLVADDPAHGVVGFIDFGDPADENYGYGARIYSFYLLPEFQNRGLGTRLFQTCMSRLAEAGYGSVCLDTLEASPYRRFYEKHEGKIVGTDSHKLGEKDFGTVIYGWNLTQNS